MPSNRTASIIAIVAVSALIAIWGRSWSLPSKSDIRRDFLATEPHAKISNVKLTEGDSDHVYYDVEFSRGSSSEILVCEIGARVNEDRQSYTIFHRRTKPKAMSAR